MKTGLPLLLAPAGLLIAIWAGLFLLGLAFSETVTNHYATRAEAEAASLFERGWLPDIIPVSSSEITTRNDLDLNTSTGAFKFSPEDAPEFVRHLTGTRNPNQDVSTFSYSHGDSTWFFDVSFRRGHCQYSMSYRRPHKSEQADADQPTAAVDLKSE
jgi:hypothetical protein